MITVGEDEGARNTDGTKLPMFSRTGRGTKNMYLVFQTSDDRPKLTESKLETVSEDSSDDGLGVIPMDLITGNKTGGNTLKNIKQNQLKA
jgi:hypothetical protein